MLAGARHELEGHLLYGDVVMDVICRSAKSVRAIRPELQLVRLLTYTVVLTSPPPQPCVSDFPKGFLPLRRLLGFLFLRSWIPTVRASPSDYRQGVEINVHCEIILQLQFSVTFQVVICSDEVRSLKWFIPVFFKSAPLLVFLTGKSSLLPVGAEIPPKSMSYLNFRGSILLRFKNSQLCISEFWKGIIDFLNNKDMSMV